MPPVMPSRICLPCIGPLGALSGPIRQAANKHLAISATHSVLASPNPAPETGGMSIQHWLPAERPREKLMQHGPQSLSNAELLAVFFGTGHSGGTAVDLAHQLLAHFGSLRELLCAERQQALAGPGMGPARYCMLQAALERARRHYREALQAGPALESPDSARGFLLAQ